MMSQLYVVTGMSEDYEQGIAHITILGMGMIAVDMIPFMI